MTFLIDAQITFKLAKYLQSKSIVCITYCTEGEISPSNGDIGWGVP